MTHTYNIMGMTCNGCVAKVKSQLLKIGDIIEAEVQLSSPQATIRMQNHVAIDTLQHAISQAGNFTITEGDGAMHHYKPKKLEPAGWFDTYKPILLIGAFITGVTILIEAGSFEFDHVRWMTNFMAGFFLVFSFFKLLNLAGFAESYSTYDIIAKKWYAWGYIYAFIELGLGIAYLLQWNPLITNMLTLIVMSISIVGVLQSVLNKKKIRCACLGAIFNLPMSTITIIEDALMIVMSGIMVLTLV